MMQPSIGKEPLMHIVKRGEVPRWRAIGIRIAAVLIGVLISMAFANIVSGLTPVQLITTMWKGVFGDPKIPASTRINVPLAVRDTAQLLCIALALAAAFKMKFWNIGGEGQVLMGALATAIVMIKVGGKVPTPVLFLLMLLAAIVAGGIWGLIPAFFKAHWNTNETLFTLMLNYIAIQLVSYYYNGWKGKASTLGKLNKATRAGWFPKLVESKNPQNWFSALLNQRYAINILVVLVLVLLMYFYLTKTKHGSEISVVGESQNTARYAGINVKKVIIRTMILSGAICGLCGFLSVAGSDQTISTGTAGGYGFTAIIVAWMSGFNPFYMVFNSFFLIFLERGTAQIKNSFPTFNDNASAVITGIILFFLVGSEFFLRYRIVFRRHEKKEKATQEAAVKGA